MLDEFLKELEELLHSTPYSGVNILPLVNKYTVDKDTEEISSIRLRIRSIIEQLIEQDLVKKSSDYHFQLAYKSAGQYSQEPIVLRGTLKFENDYKNKNLPQIQAITNVTFGDNSPIAGHNLKMGDIVQSSSKNLDLNSASGNNKNTLSKIISWIFKNVIIVVIVALISAYLIWKFRWN
ncbi:MAG: hypothetical protein K2X37_07530 [Chitinophagaceae bacterium]|nr:hypothetical protein [Chitinophagaceae bacterium]